MFLHIGNEDIILKKDIIVILDYKSINKSKINKEFIKKSNLNSITKDIEQENKVKSFIVTDLINYESSISTLTLKKRTINFNENIKEINNN